jgi:hypothetical protein
MRSVVVVLPASMWAEIPMFRYRSMGVLRDMESSKCVPPVSDRRVARGPMTSGLKKVRL